MNEFELTMKLANGPGRREITLANAVRNRGRRDATRCVLPGGDAAPDAEGVRAVRHVQSSRFEA